MINRPSLGNQHPSTTSNIATGMDLSSREAEFDFDAMEFEKFGVAKGT